MSTSENGLAQKGAFPSIITLTTDFGTADGYVAAMKGVILGINPAATIVDVTHEVRAQDIREAAFVLATTCDAFPPSAIHLVVVDPGVGSARRPIAVATSTGTFVAPDNGVLSWVLRVAEASAWPAAVTPLPVPPRARAVQLTNAAYWRADISTTFHGRDIFAPVAAYLSHGAPLADLGPPIDSIHLFPIPRPVWLGPNRLEGHVIHVDRFGNLITDIRADDVRHFRVPSVRVGEVELPGLVTHYAAGSGVVALVGSSGYVEVAVVNGSAADRLNLGVGARVEIHEQHPV